MLGLDPQVNGKALHPVVGVQLQSSTFPDKLKVGEMLDMYQSFYRNPADPEELANALGLGEKLGSYYKTLSVTPVPPERLLAAQIVINLTITVAGLIILIAAGVIAFSLELPKNFLWFLLAYLLTVTSLFAVELCIAAFVRSDALANGIGGILFFALLFFGGLWIPHPLMPPMLLNISNWTPLGSSIDAMQRAMNGSLSSLQSLLVLAAYSSIFGYLAVRYFQRE